MHDSRRVRAGVDGQVQRQLAGRLERRLDRGAVKPMHAHQAGGQVGVLEAARRHRHQVPAADAHIPRGAHDQARRGQLPADAHDLLAYLTEQHQSSVPPPLSRDQRGVGSTLCEVIRGRPTR